MVVSRAEAQGETNGYQYHPCSKVWIWNGLNWIDIPDVRMNISEIIPIINNDILSI